MEWREQAEASIEADGDGGEVTPGVLAELDALVVAVDQGLHISHQAVLTAELGQLARLARSPMYQCPPKASITPIKSASPSLRTSAPSIRFAWTPWAKTWRLKGLRSKA